jgi:hypothetical protein
MTKIENGEKVWFRGMFSEQFSVRGVIEDVDCRAECPYGIRLENGNFIRAYADQIKGRDA